MHEILDKLANGVVAGPDDLMGIGDCLNILDDLEGAGKIPEVSLESLQEVRKLFKQIILGDSGNPDAEWVRVQDLIQEICSSCRGGDNGGFGAEEEGMNEDWRAIQELMGYSGPDGAEQDGFATESAASDSACAAVRMAGIEPGIEEDPDDFQVQDPDLLRDFLEEANEHLSSIELNILSLEEDSQNQEAINAIFRPFHSIKGVAGFLNLKDIHYLSHEVENLLDDARSNKLLITDDVIDLILKSVDMLKSLLASVEKSLREGSPVPHSSEVLKTFSEQLKSLQEKEIVAPATALKKVGEILVDQGVALPDAVEEAAARSKSRGTKIGEELIAEGIASPRDVCSALREQRIAKENSTSVRIDTLKLDNLVDMVGELVIAQSMVLQNPELQRIRDQKYQKDSVQLRRITNELQRIAMSMRMVPIKSTFQKMIRLVRDLSKKSGKDVILEMHGEDTEIDRNMVEEIYDPLVHMIRNSVDHGIEAPDERVRTGKDPRGRIFLSAEQKGGNIVIDIKDDGRGLDAEKIRATAVKRGLVSHDEQLDERMIYELIFRPGFSTRETITDVSGRGVGMDVVKRSVEALRGKIEVYSYPGKGSHFSFKLPLTMAIIDGMIIYVGSERYVVPTISLKESFRPARDAYVTVHGQGEMIKVRDKLMPLVRLHEIFGVEAGQRDPWDALLLVVNEDNRAYCLLADEIAGRQEVVIKSLGSALRHVPGVSGGAILGDGKVALIIDVKGVVSQYEGNIR